MEQAIAFVFNNLAVTAEKAGVPWEQFWHERVLTTYTQSLVSLVIHAVLIIATLVVVTLIVKWIMRQKLEHECPDAGYMGLGAIGLFLIIMLAGTLPAAVVGFVNPEYRTLMEIYDKAANLLVNR